MHERRDITKLKDDAERHEKEFDQQRTGIEELRAAISDLSSSCIGTLKRRAWRRLRLRQQSTARAVTTSTSPVCRFLCDNWRGII